MTSQAQGVHLGASSLPAFLPLAGFERADAAAPSSLQVAVLGMSVLFGLEQMQPRKFIIVIAISCGGASPPLLLPGLLVHRVARVLADDVLVT